MPNTSTIDIKTKELDYDHNFSAGAVDIVMKDYKIVIKKIFEGKRKNIKKLRISETVKKIINAVDD